MSCFARELFRPFFIIIIIIVVVVDDIAKVDEVGRFG